MKAAAKLGKANRAFTMVELLSLLSVLALLLIVRLPALAKSGAGNAERVACLNNARQLVVAAFAYSADFDERWVPNNLGDNSLDVRNPPTDYKPAVWIQGREGSDFTDEDYAARLVSKDVSLLPPYLADKGSLRCPSQRPRRIGGKALLRARSYSMNIFFGWDSAPASLWHGEPGIGYRHFNKIGDASAPASFFLFAEVNPSSICNPPFGTHPSSQNIFHLPGDQHGPDSNFAFADGHAESHRWVSPLFTSPTSGGRPMPESDGFWHNHDTPHPNATKIQPDVAWLNTHATEKIRN